MLDLLLPRRCALCGRSGRALCRGCVATLPPAVQLAPPPGFASCASLLSYEGPTRELVAAIKYRAHLDALDVLGAAMAELVEQRPAAVTWAPTSAERRRARGYDQAELLARRVATALDRPCTPLLVRAGAGGQVGRNRAERLDGVGFTTRRRPHGHVLVVDDVRTTGATLAAAGDALLDAGAATVHGLTLAVTP